VPENLGSGAKNLSSWLFSVYLSEADGIRTRNFRIDSPVDTSERQALAPDGAQEGAPTADTPVIYPDLAQVATAWATLPDHIRAAILALVTLAKEAKQ